MCNSICAGFIVLDLKVAGKLMGVPISERSVLHQAWPVRWNWL